MYTYIYKYKGDSDGLLGVDLIDHVVNSWLPFVEFLCSLKVALHCASSQGAQMNETVFRNKYMYICICIYTYIYIYIYCASGMQMNEKQV
jgi:hypothetical protein